MKLLFDNNISDKFGGSGLGTSEEYCWNRML